MSQPADPEALVFAVLAALDARFEHVVIDPAYADTAAYCAHYGDSFEHAANTIVVASRREPKSYAACVVPATRRLDVNRCVRDLLGAGRLSFAGADEMRALTGMEVGGVTPFGLPPALPLYLDGTMMRLPYVIVGTGGRTGKLRLAPTVFARLPGARVIEDLSLPAVARDAGDRA
jgi:prolyl-tRNA editing enzyme YbaK/EbsC (Cys-tRNA(Pro) deacylase)